MVAAVLAALLVAGAIAAVARIGTGARAPRAVTVSRRARPATANPVRVGSESIRRIPAGFVGLSMETDGLTTAGGPPGPFDPVLAQLIRSLSPGGRPVLRIGGDSTDYSWWPVGGMRRPAGVHYALTPQWLAEVRALAQATNARLILGINLQAGSSRVAGTEARALVDGIGRRSVLGLEPGNEPELYRSVTAAAPGAASPATIVARRFAAFVRLYSRVTTGLPGALAGPSIGSDKWLPGLGAFLGRERQVRVVTVHRYPLKHCGGGAHNTLAALLSAASSTGLARSLIPSIRAAHAAGLPLRVDELNSVSCGGQAGVSDTFASALWALNTLFEMARVGVDGVNVHTRPLSLSQLFDLRRSASGWRAAVRPEYYGLLAFAAAAPAGARLLSVSQPSTAGLHVWATRTAAGKLTVVLINETSHRRTLAVTLPGRGSFVRVVLRANSLGATSGVTLGGLSFGPATTTGVLAGAGPSIAVTPYRGTVRVPLPASSATLLTSGG